MPALVPAAPSRPAAVSPAAASASIADTAANGAGKVSAPMPGTILAVNVSIGAAVKKGDVLFILEAMKMENEIMAPCDGVVSAVGVAMKSGTLLCTIG